MTLAARTRQLTLWVHAVDDAGALCGARPANGRWFPSQHIPVNCPRCLWALSRPRYAICEEPNSRERRLIHIREVGAEGVAIGASRVGTRSLCGRVIGWDRGPLTEDRVTDPDLCDSCKRRLIEIRTS